jgi:hypothetical protein
MDDGPTPRVDDDHVPLGELTLRVLWMTIQLIMVFYLGQQGALFFYQRF